MSRSKLVITLVAALAVLATFFVTPVASAGTLDPNPGQYYHVKNDFSHLCMDVAYGSKFVGARIQQWDCLDISQENWRFDVVSTINRVKYYHLVNKNSGLCLDVPNGSTTPGVELQQWTCWSGDMQQWALVPAGGSSVTLKNLGSGYCVDDKNWGGAGASLQQWDCNNLAVQTWQIA